MRQRQAQPLTSSAAMTMSAAPVSNKIPGNRLTRLSLSAKKYDSQPCFAGRRRERLIRPANTRTGRGLLHHYDVKLLLVIKRFDLNFNLFADKDFDFRQRV